MDKTIRVGKGDFGNIFCSIQYNNGRLSITGVEGPMRNGDAKGGCGQIVMSDWDVKEYSPGLNADTVAKFRQYWAKWHLNDMQAGTPVQTAILARRKAEYKGYPESYYDWALRVLAEEGLAVDNGYKYGSSWLKVEVPAEVIAFFESLPDTDVIPAWV